MGLLWRLFAPKPLKRARRSVRRVAHPVCTLTPKPIKQVRRMTYNATHPISATKSALERASVAGWSRQTRPARRASNSRVPLQGKRTVGKPQSAGQRRPYRAVESDTVATGERFQHVHEPPPILD
jgi:hypothetical protein